MTSSTALFRNTRYSKTGIGLRRGKLFSVRIFGYKGNYCLLMFAFDLVIQNPKDEIELPHHCSKFMFSFHCSQILTPAKDSACVCCEVSSKLLARCNQCDGFLCKKGLQIHQTIKCLRKHQVFNLEDLQSGKIDLSLACDKNPMCKKHKGQGLWFFCETCNILICRDCTVVSHKSTDHVYVELDSAVLKQKNAIQQLVKKSNATALKIDGALCMTRSTKRNLEDAAERVLSDIETTTELAIKRIRKLCSDEKNRVQEHVNAAENKLDATETELCSQQIRLKRTQETATSLLKEGSDFDVASVYQQLATSFSMTSFTNPSSLERGLCHITFKPDYDFFTNIKQLGTLDLGVGDISQGQWVLEEELGLPDTELGHLKCPSGIAATLNGDLVVANCHPSTPVHIYSPNSTYKLSLDKRSRNATDVLVAPSNGNIYVTTEKSKYVRVYDENALYLRKFSTVPPKEVNTQNPSSTDDDDMSPPNGDVIDGAIGDVEARQTSDLVMIRGLAFMGSNNHVIVGEEKSKYISIHDINDKHVSSFSVPVTPYFLAVTQEDNIVISAREENTAVHIVDTNGNQLRTIHPDENTMDSWFPSGLCVSMNNEICITNFGEGSKGVDCFTTSGEYRGCMCDTIQSPEGLMLMANDQKLAVAEWEACTVKVFRLLKD